MNTFGYKKSIKTNYTGPFDQQQVSKHFHQLFVAPEQPFEESDFSL